MQATIDESTYTELQIKVMTGTYDINLFACWIQSHNPVSIEIHGPKVHLLLRRVPAVILSLGPCLYANQLLQYTRKLKEVPIDCVYFIDMKFGQYIHMVSKLIPSQVNRFIIGNSSADFDSVIGALVYGYIKFLLFREVFIPLADCKRTQLPLRFEIVRILDRHQVDTKALWFKEEVRIGEESVVLLYDHNLREGVKPLEIVDHHPLKDKDCKKVLVGHCGSAMTLLYYLLRPNQLPQNNEWTGKYKQFELGQKENCEYDPVVDQLIRVGILLDTYNVSQSLKSRWDIIDLIALQNIEKRSKNQLISFEQLEAIKFDQKLNLKLSVRDHLIKDFKAFTYKDKRIAYSVILMSSQSFVGHYGKGIEQEIDRQWQQHKYSAYFLMFLYKKGDTYTRQLILVCQQKDTLQVLEKVLTHKLQMSPTSKKNGWVLYAEGTIKTSRKVLEKAISDAFQSSRTEQL